jgi:UrcA family protein
MRGRTITGKGRSGSEDTNQLTEETRMNSNTKTSNRFPLALSSALLLTSWAGSSAFAGEGVRSAVVKFHDLNVDAPEGVRALYGRIHAAAGRVCSESDPILRIGGAVCARKAEATAIAKLNLPQLTAYYNLKMKAGGHSETLIAAR